jgi:hypothetical protein
MIVRRAFWLLLVTLAVLSGPLPRARAGMITFAVGVDTSAISGQQGFIDIQFNPGPTLPAGPPLPATATVTNFTSDATLLASLNGISAGTDGAASGTLPGTLTINNTFALNDVFQPATYGQSLDFTVALSGPGVDNPNSALSGSSFALTLYASDFMTTLLTTDPAGTVATINLNADGSTTALTFPATPGGSATATVTPSAPPAVPEPSTLSLTLLGLAGGCLFRWRLRQPKYVR